MNEVIKFDAAIVNFYTENGVKIIGVADDNDDPKNFIIISRLDEDDVSPEESVGLQTSFLDQEYTEAISKIVVTNRRIDVFISKNINETNVTKVEIMYDSSKINTDEFVKYINDIFNDVNVDVQISV